MTRLCERAYCPLPHGRFLPHTSYFGMIYNPRKNW